jgi:hypothetical protein
MNVVQRLSSSRALLLGGGILVFGVFAAMVALSCRCKAPPAALSVERWVLDAQRDPNCYYGSAWNDGDVVMPRAGHDQPVRFVHVYTFEDDCTWRGVETLTPDGHGGYKYRYDDVLVSCAPDATPAPQCPLEGKVHIVPVEDAGRNLIAE